MTVAGHLEPGEDIGPERCVGLGDVCAAVGRLWAVVFGAWRLRSQGEIATARVWVQDVSWWSGMLQWSGPSHLGERGYHTISRRVAALDGVGPVLEQVVQSLVPSAHSHSRPLARSTPASPELMTLHAIIDESVPVSWTPPALCLVLTPGWSGHRFAPVPPSGSGKTRLRARRRPTRSGCPARRRTVWS